MTATIGVFNDCLTYANNHKLPITFVIEDNGLSTDTKTAEVWGINNEKIDLYFRTLIREYPDHIKYVKYTRRYPHYGIGKFISKIWEETDETKQKGF